MEPEIHFSSYACTNSHQHLPQIIPFVKMPHCTQTPVLSQLSKPGSRDLCGGWETLAGFLKTRSEKADKVRPGSAQVGQVQGRT